MNRTLVCALTFGLAAAIPAAASAQDGRQGNTAQFRMKVAQNQNQNGETKQRTVVKKRPNETVRRTVVRRPNGNVRVERKVIRPPRRYRARRVWVAPRGYVYRRFALGGRIPALLLAAPYFLTSYAYYGLSAPPPGYVWVRNGSDAMLVDRYTGEVVQVEYGLFY